MWGKSKKQLIDSVKYDVGKNAFLVSYNLVDVDPESLQVYDRIEVKEVMSYPGVQDITNGVGQTQSICLENTVEAKSYVDLGIGDGKYYAIFISGLTNNEIARSRIFTQKEIEMHANSENVSNGNEDNVVCDLKLTKIRKMNHSESENCEITLGWEFSGDEADLKSLKLSNSDWICIVPSNQMNEIDTTYFKCAFGMASGKKKGVLKLLISGLVEADREYQIVYYDTDQSVNRGSSEPFTIASTDLPELNGSEVKNAAQEDSRKYNTMSVMQYTMQDQIKNLDEAPDYNPLLSIVPQKGKWLKMIEDNQKKIEGIQQEADAEFESAKANDIASTSANPAQRKDKVDPVLNDKRTEKKLSAALHGNVPFFLFLGAGISIDAPSSSPSWWTLMSNVLEETFKAVPEEHQAAAKKLRTSDASRSPEEVMETYYFVLQNKLFELFELLNEGEPNANHRIVAKMAKAGKVKSILTTNFDEFIEQALDIEKVPYKVICTNGEFKEYYKSGCKDFAILKIHGTVSRPETIVAVSNHYKTGKGFGGMKSVVTQTFIKNFPTLFLGYSGWDFVHANYQEFWNKAGDNGGEQIYFVKYKGAKGGPLISNLVGKHVGKRLVIGEGIMPELACSLMAKVDATGAEDVVKFHQNIEAGTREFVQAKQRVFIFKWVQKIPKSALLAILWNEAAYLNESTNERLKRIAASDGNTETANLDTNAMQAYIMQLVTQMTQGIISEEEYTQKQRKAVIEMTLAHAVLPSKIKEKLVTLCLKIGDSNPLFQNENSDELLAMFPSYVLSAASGAPLDSTAQDLVDIALRYVSDTLDPLYKGSKTDRRSKILYDLYYSQSNFLRIHNDDVHEAEGIIETFADEMVGAESSDKEVTAKIASDLAPKIQLLAFQQIDIDSMVESMVGYVVRLSEESAPTDDILESAFIIAVSLHKQASYRTSSLYSNKKMQQIFTLIGIDEKKVIPKETLEAIKIDMEQPIKTILNILQDLVERKDKGRHLTPKEVIATFDLAFVETFRQCIKNIGSSADDERVREARGYYPRDPLPPSAASYLSSKLLQASAYIKDDRAENPCLAALASLGESARDIVTVQHAVKKSLSLTEGKVTELTPAPVPEVLAAIHQENGDFDEALHFYKLALEGIRTFVMRQKTDAIVLNACLVQATFDVKEALKMAFEFSPFFSENQQYGVKGPGRNLLVQQVESWAAELGLSLDEARVQLFANEGDGQSQGTKKAVDQDPEPSSTAMLSERSQTKSSFPTEKGETKDGDSPSKQKTRPAVTGDKTCANCNIM